MEPLIETVSMVHDPKTPKHERDQLIGTLESLLIDTGETDPKPNDNQPSDTIKEKRECENAGQPWVETPDGGFCGKFGILSVLKPEESEGAVKEKELAEGTLAVTECIQDVATTVTIAALPNRIAKGAKIVKNAFHGIIAIQHVDTGRVEDAAWEVASIWVDGAPCYKAILEIADTESSDTE
ncbi:hypothetical protein ACM01_40095 [Streptomyces viridochromogenes]|uniref:Uncharacterized protein n=2 Tax=Streptomyces viridochromogenes TaxID=1938 RepID=A0A0J7YXC2_STRVR|nr:hypothetical protein ACM01_40095 [Streptomyces viridochromogenes]KOG14067.1 hypothetical protein ADK35_31440 [Streptomyces viridochromogenes]KOG26870.1 hypothetical protein ADK36_02675 [Streptomyces viridochromogenes]